MINLREQVTAFGAETGNNHKIPVREVGVRSISENLLRNLSAKQKLVLSSRFGIGNGQPKTLEAIGKNLNITRERVRQIESDAIKVLGRAPQDDSLKALTREVNEIIVQYGGLIWAERLLREFFSRHFGKNNYSSEEGRMAEILFLLAGLKKQKGNREIRDSWAGSQFDKKYFKAAVDEIERIFDSERKILETEDLIKKLAYGDFSQKYPSLRRSTSSVFWRFPKSLAKMSLKIGEKPSGLLLVREVFVRNPRWCF